MGWVNSDPNAPLLIPNETSRPAMIRDGKLDRMQEDSRSFDANVQALFEELELATQWHRPSILLAICKSKITHDKAQEALQKKLVGLGQTVVRIDVDREHADVLALMLERGNGGNAFFFVSKLDQVGGTEAQSAYRMLNLHREGFVENRIKAVFWLSPSEASNLPRQAPDFWSFRHRVVEFASPRASSITSLPAGVLCWRLQETVESLQSIRKSIVAHEELLSKLPDQPEASSQRIELAEVLGHLYWKLGENPMAVESLSRGVAAAQNAMFLQTRAWLLNGVAIITYERKEYQKAGEIYSEILESNPKDGFLWINFAITLCALGKNREAIFRAEQGLKLTPLEARLWNSAGHLHIALGRLDEAIPFFQKAIGLSRDVQEYHVSLAACYSLIGLSEESLREIDAASASGGGRRSYLGACKAAVLGNREESLRLLKSGVSSGEILAAELRRDANLSALLGVTLLETVH